MTNDPREHASADVAPELYATDGSGRPRTEADATEADTDSSDDAEPRTDHLDDIEEGAGCTEIWDHLSEKRAENAETKAGSESDADADSDTETGSDTETDAKAESDAESSATKKEPDATVTN